MIFEFYTEDKKDVFIEYFSDMIKNLSLSKFEDKLTSCHDKSFENLVQTKVFSLLTPKKTTKIIIYINIEDQVKISIMSIDKSKLEYKYGSQSAVRILEDEEIDYKIIQYNKIDREDIENRLKIYLIEYMRDFKIKTILQ